MQQGAYPATPVAIATNILNTIYPHNEKYQNLQRPSENYSTKFFGSETLSTKFSETFTENYQQTEGVNFPDYESQKSDGYQDLSGTTVEYDYSEVKKRKKKKKGGRK